MALLIQKDIRRLAALGHYTILIDHIMALLGVEVFPHPPPYLIIIL